MVGVIVLVALLALCGVSSTSGIGVGASSASSSGGGKQNQSVIIQTAPQPVQQGPQASRQENTIKTFAVRNYAKIAEDDKNGSGEYFASLVTLMATEGISKEDAPALIRQALRRANGNATTFGEQIDKLME